MVTLFSDPAVLLPMPVRNTSASTSEFQLLPAMVQNVLSSLKDSSEMLCLVTRAFASYALKTPACPLRCHHLE